MPGGGIFDLPIGLFSKGVRCADAGGGGMLYRQYFRIASCPAAGKPIIPLYSDALLYSRIVAWPVAVGEGCQFSEVARAGTNRLALELRFCENLKKRPTSTQTCTA